MSRSSIYRTLPRLVRTRKMPGNDKEYHRGDLERLSAACTTHPEPAARKFVPAAPGRRVARAGQGAAPRAFKYL